MKALTGLNIALEREWIIHMYVLAQLLLFFTCMKPLTHIMLILNFSFPPVIFRTPSSLKFRAPCLIKPKFNSLITLPMNMKALGTWLSLKYAVFYLLFIAVFFSPLESLNIPFSSLSLALIASILQSLHQRNTQLDANTCPNKNLFSLLPIPPLTFILCSD